jgi:hypothetical protein
MKKCAWPWKLPRKTLVSEDWPQSAHLCKSYHYLPQVLKGEGLQQSLGFSPCLSGRCPPRRWLT